MRGWHPELCQSSRSWGHTFFEKAVQNPVQQASETPGKHRFVHSPGMGKPRKTLFYQCVPGFQVAAEGFEPPTRGL